MRASAISNAFGSNTFNILVGLGLPWFLFIWLSEDWQEYHQLPATGIVGPVALLIGILFVFLALLAMNDFVLYTRHAYACFATYAAFLLYALVAS